MYKMISWKYGRKYAIHTNKQEVMTMLASENLEKGQVTTHKRSVSVYFHDDKFSERYTIPVKAWNDIYNRSEA